MKLMDVIKGVAREVLPKKSIEQVIEEQNTRSVWYPRVWSLPRRYVYGKVPGEPVADFTWRQEKKPKPRCRPETDERIIREHSAECSRQPGSRGGLCAMCKLLNNPKRMDFLVRLYRNSLSLNDSCLNVGNAQDGSGLFLAATSTYLRQLADIGLVRRERSGRLVNYYPDFTRAAEEVQEIAALIMHRLRKEDGNMSFAPVFRVMMGAIRARVVRYIASGGDGCVEHLSERFQLQIGDLRHYLKFAEEGGMLVCNSDDPDGVYRYIAPADPIARRIVELS